MDVIARKVAILRAVADWVKVWAEHGEGAESDARLAALHAALDAELTDPAGAVDALAKEQRP